jgi:hypothetical protein
MLKKFISFHGLIVLKNCLSAHIESKTICRHQILVVLKMLPIVTKNAVAKLEDMVGKMTDLETYGYDTSTLAKDLIETWSTLLLVYKIPKRPASMIQMSREERSNSPSKKSSESRLSEKRNRCDDDDSSHSHRRPRKLDSRPSHHLSHSMDWKPKPVQPLLPVKLPPGWTQSYEDGQVCYRNSETMELSWDVPTAPIVPIEPGAVNVLQGFSSDQLKSVIEAAQEAAKLQMIEQEKVAAAKKEKHRLRKEKEKEYRIKEKERKLKEREEKERSRAERKEEKLAALDGKLRVPDAEAEDSTATPATPYHAEVQSGWTPAQIKSIKNQVYTANVVF